MVIDNSRKNSPKSVIQSKSGLLQVTEGEILQINELPYQVISATTKVKVRGEIHLTTQFIYVEPVNGSHVLNPTQNKLCPAT